MGRKTLLALILAVLGYYAYGLLRADQAETPHQNAESSEPETFYSESAETAPAGYTFSEEVDEPQTAGAAQDQRPTEAPSAYSSSSAESPMSSYGNSTGLRPLVSSSIADEDDEDALEEEIAARDAAAARERILARQDRDDVSYNALPFLPLSPRAKRLSENWNFQAPGVSKEEIAPMLSQNQPKSITYFGSSGISNITPSKTATGTEQTDRNLNLASPGFVTSTAKAREDSVNKNILKANADASGTPSASKPSSSTSNPAVNRASPTSVARAPVTPNPTPTALIPMSGEVYEVESFTPGLRDDGTTLEPVADSAMDAISKLDYDTTVWFNPKNKDEVKMHLSKVLSFGHGGTLILKIKDNGFIVDEPGVDFALYENAFKTSAGNIYQEFAGVGVSNSLDEKTVRWFPCDPKKGDLRGCFGAVSGDDRSDQFDLADIQIQRAKYIWIRDLGDNQNLATKEAIPSEGVDLDFVRIDHAFYSR
jgi:hypothetical protein